MCGIAAIVNPNIEYKDQSIVILNKMLSAQVSRGPDGGNIRVFNSIFMGHRLLKILPCPHSQQPMNIEDDEYIIIFNGEIYNYRSIKEELIKNGVVFKGDTDTEVIAQMYRLYGEKLLNYLNGMYAFLIYDRKKEQLFIARDPYGQKPLYIRTIGNVHYLASSLTALVFPEIGELKVNSNALPEYLSTSQTLEYKTLFHGIRHVHPGSYIIINSDGKIICERQFQEISFSCVTEHLSFEEASNYLTNLLQKSVEIQSLHADQLAAHLSGGLDSSLICENLKRIDPSIITYSCTYNAYPKEISEEDIFFEELAYAKSMAKFLNLKNFSVPIYPDDYCLLLGEVIQAIEEPKGNSCLAHYKLAQYISQNHRIFLSGEGADELFGGYTWKLDNVFNNKKNIEESIFEKNLISSPETLKFLYNSSFFDVFEKFRVSLSLKSHSNPIDALMIYDIKVFLHYLLLQADKIAGKFGMEGRYPYLDKDIVTFALSLPVKMRYNNGELGKPLLRKVALSSIPQKIIDRKKVGFVPPESSWYRTRLSKTLIKLLLEDKESFLQEFLDKNNLKVIINEHISGKRNHRKLFWNLISLSLWHKLFFQEKSPTDISQYLIINTLSN